MKLNVIKKIILILLIIFCINNFANVSEIPTEKSSEVEDPNFKQLPLETENELTEIFKFMNSESNLNLSAVAKITKFIIDNSKPVTTWKLQKRDNVGSGAAIITQAKDDLERRIPFHFSPKLPDYVMYPITIRYTHANEAINQAYSNILKNIDKNCYTFGKYLSEEYTAPNKQAGACYHYTNMHCLIRVNLDGTNIVLSLKEMIGLSSPSIRGTEVESSHSNLFYYSSKTGLTLPGLTWVNSYIYGSKQLVIFVSTGTNQLYYGTFSWINAGYKNINLIFPGSIREVLLQAIKVFDDLTIFKNIDSVQLENLVKKIYELSNNEIDTYYKTYCDFVKKCSESGKRNILSMKTASTLNSIFDEKDLVNMEMKYKRAF